jgi:tryptophan synthase alpha chain
MVQSDLRRRQQKSVWTDLFCRTYHLKEEFAIPFKEHGLDLISLIAPTSHERIAMIAKEAEGFGISEPKQAEKMAAQSDGVIVGSAIVKLCEKYGADCVPHISTFVKEMKDAIQ